jgi:hypothetical protein
MLQQKEKVAFKSIKQKEKVQNASCLPWNPHPPPQMRTPYT